MTLFYDDAFEEQRVSAAAAMGLTLEKRGPGDAATVLVFAIFVFINFLTVLYMLWNRNYPPIKAKNVILMTCLFVSSAFWYVGDVRGNSHVQLLGSAFTDCRAIGVWLYSVLGMFTTCGLYALRSQMLYQIFKRNQPCRGLMFYLPTIIYGVCVLVFAIVSQAISEEKVTFYFPPLDLCSGDVAYKDTVISFLWAMTLYCCLMYWRVRSIRSSFNESREMAVVSSLSVLGLLISTIIQYVQPEYMLLMRYRILMTTISQLCVNFTWWSIMAVPIYNCLFNHQKYLLKWRAKLRDDGLQREYHVDSSTGMQPISDAIAPGQPASFNDKTPSTQAFYYSNESGARLVNPLDVGAAISISASSTISNH